MPSEFGLKPDPEFAPDEPLYRRVRQDQIHEGLILSAAVQDIETQHPSCSFNRGKYSRPEDVLNPEVPEFNHIAVLIAGNLPSPVSHPETQVLFSFRLEHLPEENNYSHSEVQVTREGNPMPRLKHPVLRRHLREALAEKMTVFVSP